MSLFPDSRAIVFGLPQNFDLLSEIVSAKSIRLGTAFAHKSGWEMLCPQIIDSRAEKFLLAGSNFFQTEPPILWEWLRLSESGAASAALHSNKGIMFHPKVLLVEGHLSFGIVGSGNLSRGGLQGNIECGLFVEKGVLLLQLQNWFDGVFNEATPLRHSIVLDYERNWNSLRKLAKELRNRQKGLEDKLAEKSVAVMKNWDDALSAARSYLVSSHFRKAYEARVAGGTLIKDFLRYPEFDFDEEGWRGFYSVQEFGHLIPLYRNSIFRKRDKLQRGLRQLVSQESVTLRVLNEFLSKKGKFHIKGFGLNAISKILAVHAPSNWAAYNQPVEKTLRRFGYLPPRGASAAGKFAAFTRMMDTFKSATGLQDAYALDAFFYHLFREKKNPTSDSAVNQVRPLVKERHPALSEEDKQAIRDRFDKGERSSRELAKEFGVGESQVAGLMARHLHPKSWR